MSWASLVCWPHCIHSQIMLLPPWTVWTYQVEIQSQHLFFLIYFSIYSFLLLSFFFLSLCIIKLITQSGILHFYFLISGEILWPETRLSQVQGKAWDWLWPRWRKSTKSKNLKWNPRGSMITMYHGWSSSGSRCSCVCMCHCMIVYHYVCTYACVSMFTCIWF